MPGETKSTPAFLLQPGIQAGLLLILLILVFFLNLHALDPSLMEARNFITVREITQHGNWLIPTMNGELRLAKPPLPTWLTAFSALAAGDIYNLTALRFPAAVMAAALVYFLFLLARRLTADKLIPLLAAVVLATSFSFFNVGRQGTWDIYCHAFMLGAIWLLVKGLQNEQTTYVSFAGSGLLLGLSFMSKGPVAFYALLLPFLISYGVGYGFAAGRGKRKALLLTLVIGVIVSMAWPLYVYLQHPELLAANVAQESTAWVNRHVKPFWYYVGFPLQAGIWAVFSVAALVIPYARRRLSAWGNYRFLAGWVLVELILLSVIPEKKERYLLPLLVPMALLTAHYLRYLMQAFAEAADDKWDRRIVTFNAGLFALLAFAAPVLLYVAYRKNLIAGGSLALNSILFLVIGAAVISWAKRRHIGRFILAAVGLYLAVLLLFVPLYQELVFPAKNFVGLQGVRKLAGVELLPFYVLNSMSPEYIWEVGRPVDTLRLVNQRVQLPAKIPLVLFSTDSLTAAVLPAADLRIKEISRHPYSRRQPEKVYYLYLISR